MRFRFALFCLALFAVAAAFAQTPATPVPLPSPRLSDTPLPKDPAAALELLRKVNGLGEDMKPWHVHATYQMFDEHGKASGTGTFEMWWASATKYKQVFLSDSFNQTEYGTNHGTFRIGFDYPVPHPESFLSSELVGSFQANATAADAKLEVRDLALGTMKLECFMVSQHFVHEVSSPPLGLFPTYCSSIDRPILRLSLENTTTQVARNKIVLFRNEYVAKQIAITESAHPLMNINVDEIDSLKDLPDDFFNPPSSAQFSKPLPSLSAKKGLTGGRILKGADARLPEEARRGPLHEGVVTLEGTVTRDGHMRDLNIIAAPDSAFAVSAIKAVRTYEFQPYKMNGEAIEVRLKVEVRFN